MNKTTEEIPQEAMDQMNPDPDPLIPDVEKPRIDSSLLGRLKERRQRLSAERNTVMVIPGYDDELLVRYKAISWGDIKAVVEKADKSRHPRKELYGQADILIKACDEILVRDPSDPNADASGLVPLSRDGVPIKFDARLAESLGFTAELGEEITARKVLLGTFNNDLAVTAQHGELMEWQQSGASDDDEKFLGE